MAADDEFPRREPVCRRQLNRPVIRRVIDLTYKAARRIIVAVVGVTVLLFGVVMLVTPGPALVFIPLGLAILSIEFAWARHWLRRVREGISRKGRNDRGENAESHRVRVAGTSPGIGEKKKAPES